MLGVNRQSYLLGSHVNSIVCVQHWLFAVGIQSWGVHWISWIDLIIDILRLTSNYTTFH